MLGLGLLLGCSAESYSIDRLAEETDCGDFNSESTTEDYEVVGCITEDGQSLYLHVFDDEAARDRVLEDVRRLPVDGTSAEYVLYEANWMVTCFEEATCRGFQESMGGEFEVIDEGGQPAEPPPG